jgi:hypothetical protein
MKVFLFLFYFFFSFSCFAQSPIPTIDDLNDLENSKKNDINNPVKTIISNPSTKSKDFYTSFLNTKSIEIQDLNRQIKQYKTDSVKNSTLINLLQISLNAAKNSRDVVYVEYVLDKNFSKYYKNKYDSVYNINKTLTDENKNLKDKIKALNDNLLEVSRLYINFFNAYPSNGKNKIFSNSFHSVNKFDSWTHTIVEFDLEYEDGTKPNSIFYIKLKDIKSNKYLQYAENNGPPNYNYSFRYAGGLITTSFSNYQSKYEFHDSKEFMLELYKEGSDYPLAKKKVIIK